LAGWVILLATTVMTALWMEGRPAAVLLRWEVVRLGVIALLLWSSHTALSAGVLMWSSVYGVLNVLFLSQLPRAPQASDYVLELDQLAGIAKGARTDD
jgi:hypothetical protein